MAVLSAIICGARSDTYNKQHVSIQQQVMEYSNRLVVIIRQIRATNS